MTICNVYRSYKSKDYFHFDELKINVILSGLDRALVFEIKKKCGFARPKDLQHPILKTFM